MESTLSLDDISVHAPVTDAFAQILTPEALLFMAELAHTYEEKRTALLDQRQAFQKQIDQGNSNEVRQTDGPSPSTASHDWQSNNRAE